MEFYNRSYNSIVGLAASIKECVQSGYMMMRYNDDEPLYKQEFEFVYLLPAEEREWRRSNGYTSYKRTAHFSANELLELYREHKSEYDCFAVDCGINLERKYDDFFDFLVLAEAMQALRGVIFP